MENRERGFSSNAFNICSRFKTLPDFAQISFFNGQMEICDCFKFFIRNLSLKKGFCVWETRMFWKKHFFCAAPHQHHGCDCD